MGPHGVSGDQQAAFNGLFREVLASFRPEAQAQLLCASAAGRGIARLFNMVDSVGESSGAAAADAQFLEKTATVAQHVTASDVERTLPEFAGHVSPLSWLRGDRARAFADV